MEQRNCSFAAAEEEDAGIVRITGEGGTRAESKVAGRRDDGVGGGAERTGGGAERTHPGSNQVAPLSLSHFTSGSLFFTL